MMRPLTGQRELFRRLQENNEARREQQNNVRQLSGREPLSTSSHEAKLSLYNKVLGEMRTYMSRRYVGRPNTDASRGELLNSLTDDAPIQLASRRGIGASMLGLQQVMEQTIIREMPSFSHHRTGFPNGILTEMYSSVYSNPCNEITFGMENLEQYNKKLKIQDMKDRKDANNQDFKFILEGDY